MPRLAKFFSSMSRASTRRPRRAWLDAKGMRTRSYIWRLRQKHETHKFSWRIQKKPLCRTVWRFFLSVTPLMREAGLYKYRVFLCAVRLRLEEEGSPVSVGGFHPPFIFGNTITFVPFSMEFRHCLMMFRNYPYEPPAVFGNGSGQFGHLHSGETLFFVLVIFLVK